MPQETIWKHNGAYAVLWLVALVVALVGQVSLVLIVFAAVAFGVRTAAWLIVDKPR